MALGAVLLSFALAVIGASLVWASHGFHPLVGFLTYAVLGTIVLASYAFVKGYLRRDDRR